MTYIIWKQLPKKFSFYFYSINSSIEYLRILLQTYYYFLNLARIKVNMSVRKLFYSIGIFYIFCARRGHELLEKYRINVLLDCRSTYISIVVLIIIITPNGSNAPYIIKHLQIISFFRRKFPISRDKLVTSYCRSLFNNTYLLLYGIGVRESGSEYLECSVNLNDHETKTPHNFDCEGVYYTTVNIYVLKHFISL